MVRIGMIGCGGIAGAHMAGFALIPDRAQITAVCDVDEARARAAAERVGGAARFTDFNALAQDPNVDAVDICLPHYLHAPAILAAARAGKHILCEKPLCTSLAEAAQVRDAVQQAGVILMCAHNQLFEPAIARARELIQQGALGQVYMARTTDCFRADRTAEQWGWRRTLDTAGGGELLDTGYHPSYTLLYLMGLTGQRPVEVTAMLGRNRQLVLEGEDTAHVLVRFSGGAIGQLLTSWAFPFPHGGYSFHLIGEHGQLFGLKNAVHLQPTGGEVESTIVGEVNSYHAQLPHFIDSIEHGTRPIQNEEDGIEVLELILGAYESDREKRTVAFKPPQDV
ncbi:MAG TPA: Gfo/Idh/MocA family oxidoreductase [Chloroflexota bacterium]|nr:Gfo/Idh/MocA family oxidoreductase [Chloroflexota bacterium]